MKVWRGTKEEFIERRFKIVDEHDIIEIGEGSMLIEKPAGVIETAFKSDMTA